MEKILKDIVEKRKQTIKERGIHFGEAVPEKREVPLSLPDFEKGIVICEIKRGSPSEGRMNDIADPVTWAGKYVRSGAGVISILTETDFFYGSLKDLMNVKKQYPEMSILRKDFLLSVEEVELSYRAGADLVLLIASVLIDFENNDCTLLEEMKNKAEELGMIPLIEVHNKQELDLVNKLEARLVGINSRDLKTFKINRGYPLGLVKEYKENTWSIFESGIRNETDAYFAGLSGFNAILVGSSIVKSGNVEDQITALKRGFLNGRANRSDFFRKIFHKIYIQNKPAVKVCGITNLDDARLAAGEGADLMGFIFAKSPRQISIEKAREIADHLDKPVLKVGVVVDEYIEEAVQAVKDGWLDAVQFHGDTSNEEALRLNTCWYKAVRVKEEDDFDEKYFSPFVLYDAFSKVVHGGTGKQIDARLLDYAVEKGISLCLAGGLNPENIEDIINKYRPVLIDVSSGLEAAPGKKDPQKVKAFFESINKAYSR